MENQQRIDSGLYLVPTPIGNLEDITLRAINILKAADIIACEDTRHTGLLLKHLEIPRKELLSYHEHNEEQRTLQLIKELQEEKIVVLVSDAGYPAISDPGYRLVKSAVENGINIIPLPGATAFVPALAASGFPVHNFTFLGFPPQKKGRKTFIENINNYEGTVIMYESPHRIEKLIDQMIEYLSDNRRICIAREISKLHEEFLRGTLSEIKEIITQRGGLKGEIVVVVEGK